MTLCIAMRMLYTDAMNAPIIATKLFRPTLRPEAVRRPHLLARLDEGCRRQLTLISAPAGFGKTTLVSQWIEGSGLPAAWLSLDKGDNDPIRFLSCLVASLQTVPVQFDENLQGMLASPQPPSVDYFLTSLIKGIAAVEEPLFLVLDDCHEIEAKPVNDALAFLLEHLPGQMHLVIVTREDPPLPLARLRARGQLKELRAADLRFSPEEAAEFLNRVMGLRLSAQEVADLEQRTEGWIAGLQLAAVSMQGQQDTAGFIRAFSGSHRFILDYLMEEVLQKLPGSTQHFLLGTSILERMCGPLCDAVLADPAASGQRTLEDLERANLFIVPLDNERRWFRYHHLFAQLLRQRLRQSASAGDEAVNESGYHLRASRWYEGSGYEIAAFQHAAAAGDISRAQRLMETEQMPLRSGSVSVILDWLKSLPPAVMDTRPVLWVRSATLLLVSGQTTGVEEKLRAAETAIAALPQGTEPEESRRDLIGQIACARATLAFTRYDPDAIFQEARRALDYLAPGNRPFRFTANWTMGMACLFGGDRAQARRGISEALSLAQASGDTHNTILAETSLGQIQEMDNQLYQAENTYRHILQLLDDCPLPVAGETYRGLARICYERNSLDDAESYGQRSLQLARQYEQSIDRFVISEVFLARLKLARGDAAGAADLLAATEQSVRRHAFAHRMPEVAALQVLVLLARGDLKAAASLADIHHLPLSRAKVYLAEGDAREALKLLEPLLEQARQKGWQDELLKLAALEALCRHMLGDKGKAMEIIGKALLAAEPEGFIRLFIDEGSRMAGLLKEAAGTSQVQAYVAGLLVAFQVEPQAGDGMPASSRTVLLESLNELLSPRELEVLRLISNGLSNHEICERLFLALDTVKGHNRRIFEKLRVQSRTQAVARARELGLI
ncbi:MAG: LuxR C-terminal-related transcriptional regulator [Christensenellales bacterium]